MKWFTIEELTESATATKYKIKNEPNEQQKELIEEFINIILDPIRDEYGKPIFVNSGFRCDELNKKVGGAKNSHHKCEDGYVAADITSGTKNGNRILFGICLALNIPYCQLIDESCFSWIHISYNKDDIRKQVLHL